MKATFTTEMQLLSDVAQSVTRSLNLDETLKRILISLDTRLKLQRGTVALLDPDTETINIRVAHGLGEGSKIQSSCKVGEGITGRVVQTGNALVVRYIAAEPGFPHKTRWRQADNVRKIALFCVPIKLERRTVGTLSVDCQAARGDNFGASLRLLNVVATMVAQAIKLNNMVELERASWHAENARLRRELKTRFAVDSMVGRSPAMREVFRRIRQVADSTTTVLIRGESGTGKDLVAHAIHYGSVRADKPFIRVNCLALPETLLESELFGHEKGAFAGAVARKVGRFEQANGGTIFLDEIGEFPLSLQAQLLRVTQFQEFERIGGSETIKANVRVINATHQNLEPRIAEGGFLPELYRSINAFPICLPPLRERKEDIVPLADRFLEHFVREHGKPITRISTPAMEALTRYHWPGNVRELENCIERAVLVCDDNVIRGEHLPPSLQMIDRDEKHAPSSFAEIIAHKERELIVNALAKCSGQQCTAAVELGITKRILGYKIKKYGIQPKQI